MSGGFYAGIPDAWEHVADFIPKPWPDFCAANDLRWFADGVKMKRVEAWPTQAQLQRRWGWESWRQVWSLVNDVSRWSDDKQPGMIDFCHDLVDTAKKRSKVSRGSSGVAAGQERGSEERTNADSRDETGQSRGSSGVAAGYTRAFLITPDHPSTLSPLPPSRGLPTPGGAGLSAAPPPEAPAHPDAPCGALLQQQSQGATLPGRNADGQPATQQPSGGGQGSAASATRAEPHDLPGISGAGGVVGVEPTGMQMGSSRRHLHGVPACAPGGDSPGSVGHGEGAGADDPDLACWSLICAAVGKRWKLDTTWRKWIAQGAARMDGGHGDWRRIARWLTSEDPESRFWRERGDPVTIIREKQRPLLLAKAIDWEKRGSSPSAQAVNGYALPPTKAFGHILDLIQTRGVRGFERFHGDERTHYALRRATMQFGGREEIGRMDPFRLAEVRKAFPQVYADAWHQWIPQQEATA